MKIPVFVEFGDFKTCAGVYRFAFNGQERDDEVAGVGNIMTAEFWEYDARLGRRWNLDPIVKYWESGYATFSSNPIFNIDADGDNAGDYYKTDGKHLGSDGINDKKVYIADDVTKNEKGVVTGAKNSVELSIKHDKFQKMAATVFGESSAYKTKGKTAELKKEMFAIASVHQRNKLAYGANSDQADLFNSTNIDARNDTKMQIANAAVINALTGGFDYSYGATNWDGIEQAAFKPSNTKYSNGRFEIHKNTIGWNISDDHYDKWKEYAKSKGYAFHAPKVSATIEGTYHRNKKLNIHIRGGQTGFKSTAVYGGTIFWKNK